MESPHGLTAILLCCSLCLPSPLVAAQQAAGSSQPTAKAKSRQNDVSGQLRGDERILQALNRFTFGPKPGDLETVRTMGLDKWFEEQLHPANLDEADLNARLAEFPAMQWSIQDLFFRLPSNPIIRQAADGKVQVPQGGTLQAVYENQIYRLQARKTAKADQGTLAANSAPGAAAGGENSTMTAYTSRGMEPNDQAMSQPGPGPAGAGQTGTRQTGTRQAETAQAPDMNAMAPAASGTNSDQASAPAPAPSPANEALIQRILALPQQQRVLRLQQMQPEEFESFIKSLRPVQR